jgi:hypothetical protein
MKKPSFLASKSWSDVFESLVIPLFPNVPTCQNCNFHKPRSFESFPGIYQDLSSVPMFPRYLQIIPRSRAEHTIEEQVPQIFQGTARAKNTTIRVGNIPVPSNQHILCIHTVMKKQPSKKFVLGSTLALPKTD